MSELDVVQPSDPILFFAEDGRRLPANLPLPPDHVWLLRPADRDLTTAGELRVITETPVPFGWEGWHLQLASLEKASSVSLAGGPRHVVQGYARPRLLLGEPLAGMTTPYGSPVYAEPPQLWLPDAPGSVISWHADVRPAAGGSALVSREIDQTGTVDLWAGVPRPILGAFEITVRGPLGRGVRRTVFIAEGVSVSYRPAVRALRMSGLEPGHAELQAPIGAAVKPARLSFGPAEKAHIAELLAGQRDRAGRDHAAAYRVAVRGRGRDDVDRRADPRGHRSRGGSRPPARTGSRDRHQGRPRGVGRSPADPGDPAERPAGTRPDRL